MRLSTSPDRDEARARATVHAALEAGLTIFDTAHAPLPGLVLERARSSKLSLTHSRLVSSSPSLATLARVLGVAAPTAE